MATVKYVGPNIGKDDKWIITAADFKNAGQGFTHRGVEFNSQGNFEVEIEDPALAEWLAANHNEFEVVEEPTTPEQRYGAMSKDELKAEVEARRLTVGGTGKQHYVEALVADDTPADAESDG